MIGLIQRVTQASVSVSDSLVGEIQRGLCVLIGVEKGDSRDTADKLLQRLLTYRVFADQDGKMNLSLSDIEGGLLLVPQFTLAADTRKGRRPGFHTAAEPIQGKELFEYFCQQADSAHKGVQSGLFGADMLVNISNDGPVTFWLTA